MLDAHQLNVFLIAAETLNFSQTARRLHMSQPSVSQHIQTLERSFGTELFLRKGRHISLTDAGKTLMPMAREMVRQSRFIEETMNSLKGEVYGHLLVGCSTTPGKYILPLLLADFHRQHPKVSVTCKSSNQDETLRNLLDGEVNVALVSKLPDSREDPHFKHFMCDPIVLIAPLDHPWAASGEIGLDELVQGHFITRESTSGTYQTVQQKLVEHGVSIQDLRVLLTLGNSESIALAVQEGLGVGFVSTLIVKRLSPQSVRLVKVREFDRFCQEIYLGQQTRHPASAAQIAFSKFIDTIEVPAYREEVTI